MNHFSVGDICKIEDDGTLGALGVISPFMRSLINDRDYIVGTIKSVSSYDCRVSFNDFGKEECWYVPKKYLKLVEVTEDEFDAEPVNVLLL